MKSFINFVLFQLCWSGFVGGAGHGMWWIGLIPLTVFVGWQIHDSAVPKTDRTLVVAAALLGFVVDTAFLKAGLLTYASPEPFADFAPAWMTGLWIAFALTLNHSMKFLHGKPVVGVVFGAIGGPLAYYAAAHAWNALVIHDPNWHAYLALAIGWGLLTPLLVGIAVKLSAREQPSVAATA